MPDIKRRIIPKFNVATISRPKHIAYNHNENFWSSKLNQEMPSLPSVLRINGLTYQRVPMVDDGNCFFRAVSFWVYGNQEQHADVRQLIVSHIMSNWNRYKSFIIGDDSYHNRIRSMYDYVECMQEDGRFGGSQECVATSEVFCVQLIIFTLGNLQAPQIYGPMHESTFTFLFSGSQDNGHFDVILRHDHVTLEIYET